MPTNQGISEATKLAVMQEMGRRGGKAKVTKGIGSLTDAERRAISMKGVAARKAKKAESNSSQK